MMPFVQAYLQFIIVALPFKAASVTLGCMFRFQGQFIKAMVGLGFGAILNVILDPVFIFVLEMGVRGAAIATAAGQICSFLLMTAMCGRGGSVSLDFGKFRFDRQALQQYVGIGFPSLLKNALSCVAAILLNTAASAYGDSVVAAMSIVSRCTTMCNTAFFGLTESLQTFISFNYGAGCYSRMRKALRFVIRFGMGALTILAVCMFAGAGPIIRTFRTDVEVVSAGTVFLRAQCLTLPLLPITSAGFVFLQAMGQNKRAALVGTGRQALFLIPITLFLPRLLGVTGVQMAQPISDVCAVLLGIVVLRPVLAQLEKLERQSGMQVRRNEG